jgi:hypothetical protein
MSASVLLKINIVQQKSSLDRIKSEGRNFIRNSEKTNLLKSDIKQKNSCLKYSSRFALTLSNSEIRLDKRDNDQYF